jgi:hypothetical protein
MANPIALSAKNATIDVNGSTFYGMSWECNPETDWLDVTNFESGGFGYQISDIFDCGVTIEGFWDAGNNPHEDLSYNMVAGYTMLNVTLYVDYENFNDLYWTFPYLSVQKVTVGAKIKDKVMIRVQAKNAGDFSYPGLITPIATDQSSTLA